MKRLNRISRAVVVLIFPFFPIDTVSASEVGQPDRIASEERTPLSREEFRRRVAEYSNRLKMSRENLQAAEFNWKKVRAGRYPSLDAQASFDYRIDRASHSAGTASALRDYSYAAQLVLRQNVYAGHGATNRMRAAEIEREIAGIEGELTLENVIYSADLTYWSLSATQQQRDIARLYVRIVDSLFRIVNSRFQEGYVSRTDLLMVETRLNEAKLQEIAAEKLYLAALQNLNTLMGNRETTLFYATDTIAQPMEMPVAVAFEAVLAARPDYRIAQRKVDLSDRNIRLARAPYNPQFSVGFQGVCGMSQFTPTGEGNLYGVAFAQLDVPLFRWNERRHGVNTARAEMRNAQWALAETVNTANGELAVARNDMERNYERVRTAEANLAVALDNLALNTFSYSEGRLPILDVLSAQVAWIQSYTAFVNSNYDYKVSIAGYDKAQGMLAGQAGLSWKQTDR